jgi:surface protein
MGRSVHPQLRMKRLFRFLLAAVCFAAVACTDYQVDIDRLEDRVGELETSKIANISQQISQINASIPVLQSSSAELKNMINSVSETVDGYGSAITKNEAGLTNLKNDISNTIETLRAGIEASQDEDKQQMLDALNAAKAELEAQIAALKTDTQSEFDQMNEVLANLKEKDASIEARIDSLKAFVNEELTSQKDWATKTFATLEQQQALQDEISDVKGSITALQTSMAELEKRLTEDYTKAIQEAVSGLQTSMSELEKRVTDAYAKAIQDAVSGTQTSMTELEKSITEAYVKAIQEAVSNLDSKIPASADEITKAYTAAIATAKSEITTAYEAKLASSIETLEKNLKTWVNETLKSYWTISETQSELRELKTGLQNQLDRHSAYITGIHNVLGDTGSLSKTIVELIKDNAAAITKNENSIKELSAQLDTAKANIRTQYKAAIADAVKEDGVVDKLIAKRIDEYNTELQTTITSIKTDITGLKTDVGNLQKNMKTLRDSVVTVWTKLDKFIDGRIQSLTYIPVSMDGEYLAGTTTCMKAYGNFVMNFQVNPASMVKDIKSLDQISATASYVEPSDKKMSSTKQVKVLSFKTHEYAGILEVTVAADDVFYGGTHRAAISVSVKDLTNKYYDVASEFVYVNAHPFFVRYTTIGNDKAFNPYKLNFYKDVTNYTAFDDAKMRESLLGHYFVEAPTETVTLDVQFAASDTKVNAKVDTLVFGEIINPKYYDRPSVGDHLNQVALKTGKDAFSNSTALKHADLFFLDVSSVNTFENMFLNCKSLNYIRFDEKDVKNVTTMENMFNNCDGLTTVSLKDWKTESLKTALNMFIGCDNLTEVDLTGWNVKKLTNLQGMFADCPKLKKVTLDWKEFSSDAINLYATFRSTAITEVKAELGIKVYTTNKLFNSCTALTKVDLAGSVKMVKGTNYSYADLGHMFDGCSALTSVNLTGWTFDDMADLNNMFNGCSALQTITLDGWKLKSGTITTSMFDSCTALTTVNIKNSDDYTVNLIKAALTNSNKSSVNVVVQ